MIKASVTTEKLSSSAVAAAAAVVVVPFFFSWVYHQFTQGSRCSGSLCAKIHNVYKLFIVLNPSYLTSSKYLPRSMSKAFLMHLNIFLQATSSFIVDHFFFKNFILHFVVSEQRSNKLHLHS
jgi:hypothetical protein